MENAFLYFTMINLIVHFQITKDSNINCKTHLIQESFEKYLILFPVLLNNVIIRLMNRRFIENKNMCFKSFFIELRILMFHFIIIPLVLS